MGSLACGHGDHSSAPSALPMQPSRVHTTLQAALHLHVRLGISIRSGQNTAVVPFLPCEPLKRGAMGFRWPVWAQRLEGDGKQLGRRVCLLSPRGEVAGSPPSCSLPMAPVLLLLLSWAYAVWGFGMWLLSGGRKAFKAASVPVLNTLWVVPALVLLLL